MRLAWTTDLHLNFVSDAGVDQFLEELRDVHADAVLVGGDIGEADTFGAWRSTAWRMLLACPSILY